MQVPVSYVDNATLGLTTGQYACATPFRPGPRAVLHTDAGIDAGWTPLGICEPDAVDVLGDSVSDLVTILRASNGVVDVSEPE